MLPCSAQDLLELATSQYSAVRVRGQELLARAFKHFPGSYSLLLDPLTALLQRDPAVSHEQFKVTT